MINNNLNLQINNIKKYCCSGINNNCIPNNFIIPKTLLNSDGINKKQYAIITLLMINDNYLPGAMLLANSIRKYKLANEIDLICMVTPDISKEAIHDLKTIFDKVDLVDYIQIKEKYIKHSSSSIKNIYSKTFTKLQCLKYTNYNKILLMDLDTLVIKEDIFNLFTLNTKDLSLLSKYGFIFSFISQLTKVFGYSFVGVARY